MKAPYLTIKRYLYKQYGIKAKRISRIDSGVANFNYYISDGKKNYLFKIYRYRSLKQIDFETKILNYLASKKFPSPQPIKNRQSELFSSYNNKPCTLFKFVDGRNPKKPTAKVMLEIGKKVGRLHRLLKNKPETVKRENWDLKAIKSLVKKNKAKILRKKYPRKREIMSFLEAELAKIKLPVLPTGLTHQDIKLDNIIIDRQKKLHFIDFDNMYRGALLIDLLTTIIWACFRKDKLYKPYLNAYLKGYGIQRRLTSKEREYFREALRFRLLREAFIWIWLYSDKKAQRLCNYFLRLYKNL